MADIKASLIALKEYANSEEPINHIVFAMNEAKSDMQKRIFNSEQGAKDVNGAGLGNYSNPYANYRSKNGRQSRVVDLEFTGSLRRSLRVQVVNDSVSIIVDNSEESKKIGYIEKLYAKNIFDLSEKEQKDLTNNVNELIFNDVKQILDDATI